MLKYMRIPSTAGTRDPERSSFFHNLSDGRQASRDRWLDGLLGLLLLLECPHAGVHGATLQQFPVAPSFDDAAGFHDQDLVVIYDGGQEVRDDQGRAVFRDPLQLGLDDLLGAGIECRGAL